MIPIRYNSFLLLPLIVGWAAGLLAWHLMVINAATAWRAGLAAAALVDILLRARRATRPVLTEDDVRRFESWATGRSPIEIRAAWRALASKHAPGLALGLVDPTLGGHIWYLPFWAIAAVSSMCWLG